MKYLIIWAILFYQRVAPASIRERCLFKLSCSNYVLQGAREAGSLEAVRRLRERVSCCRGGYVRVDTAIAGQGDLVLLRLADGRVVEEQDLSERILREVS